MWDDIWFTARDGARLYARRYLGVSSGVRRPLLCLPGITGNCGEFDALASALSNAGAQSRPVFSIDCRGRGRSGLGRTSGKSGPALLTECEDILDFMTLAGLDEAAVLGNGYGGQLALIMALLRPRAVGVLVLNDSGPQFEVEGLVRIAGEAANTPLPQNWNDAAQMLKALHGRRYPLLESGQWLAMARATYPDIAGQPGRPFSPAVVLSYSLSRGTAPRETLWPQFAALGRVPALLIRAQLSDMLSEQTVARMGDVHRALEVVTVPRQGHPALLTEPATIGPVSAFLARHERTEAAAATALRAVA